MARRKLSRLVRKHEVYTAAEAAVLLGRTARTVRRWITEEGLPAARDQKPWLIDGHDLKRFLDDRDRARQVTLSETEFYCLPCRAARSPALGLVDYQPDTPSMGRLRSFCPVCEREVYRAINQADLPRFLASFEGALATAAE
ncbi:MAG: helix-turn-helix domain-containing protein [Pseudomonadota bacterium]